MFKVQISLPADANPDVAAALDDVAATLGVVAVTTSDAAAGSYSLVVSEIPEPESVEESDDEDDEE